MREAATLTTQGRSSLLNRWWRVVATGFSFAAFGLGGLLLGVVVFPLLLVIVRHHQRRSALARWVIHHLFRVFVAMMCLLGVCSVEVRHRERLHRSGLLILASHPSLIDVVFLMSLVRDADCIVKAALLRNPFTRGPVRAAGFVCNDSGPGLIDDCVASGLSQRSGETSTGRTEATVAHSQLSLGSAPPKLPEPRLRNSFAISRTNRTAAGRRHTRPSR